MKFLLEYYHVEPTEKYTQADLDKFNQTHTLGNSLIKEDKLEEVREGENKLNIEVEKKDERKTKKK